jgi:glycerol-3-phosphate acyltransferase PlsY
MAVLYSDEIKRKLFHMLIVIYVVAYWFLPRLFVLQWLLIAIILVILIEALRLSAPPFNQWLLFTLGGVHREEEANQLSGLVWTILGSFLTMLIFSNKQIVMASLLYLAFGDALAALVGRRHGRNVIAGKKTLEGSLACFGVSLVIGLIFLEFPLALAGAIVATLIEIIPWPLNDNFWMPLISATFLTLLSKSI